MIFNPFTCPNLGTAQNSFSGAFPICFSDAIYAAVQPSRQTSSAEMVRCAPGQIEEEDNARIDHDDSRQEAKDVELSRVERCQGRLQKVHIYMSSICTVFFFFFNTVLQVTQMYSIGMPVYISAVRLNRMTMSC